MKKSARIIQFALVLFLLIGCSRSQLLDDNLNNVENVSALNLVNDSAIYSGELPCGTKSNAPNQAFEKLLNPLILNAIQNSSYCIKVVFYIVRDDNGSGGFNSNNIPQIMRNLNNAFNSHNVFLYNVGIEYINSTQYYDLNVANGSNEFPGLIATNNSTSAINFYLVNKVFEGSAEYAGMAENIPSRNLVVANDMALRPTSAHEVGHCLNLFHTHRGTSEGGCNEAIDGSNCSTCGDYVCDTPADPGLGLSNLSSCVYVGGGGYNPLVENLMSYSGSCRESFTNGQANRFMSALATSSVLQPIINSNCNIPTISGVNTICDNSIYTLNNLPTNTTVTWEAIPSTGVVLSNQSASSVTVQANTSQSMNVSLIARINYTDGNRINIHKMITLTGTDVPYVSLDQASMQCFSMNSTRYFNAGYSTPNGYKPISNHPNVTEVDWQVWEYSSSSPTQITSLQKYSNSVINSSISFNMPYKSNNYVITIVPRAKSRCGGGWGEWGPGTSYYVRYNCFSPVYPFDVTYSVFDQRYTLNFSESYHGLRKTISTNPTMQNKISNNYNVHIYDENHKQVYSEKQSNKQKIIIPKLPSGKYTVELLQDGYIYTQTLEIK